MRRARRALQRGAREDRRHSCIGITDQRHTTRSSTRKARGVPVRLIIENDQYRDPNYVWEAWNVDRLVRRGHSDALARPRRPEHERWCCCTAEHEIFGSSNWTTRRPNSQAEHKLLHDENAIFQWFAAQFDRMWHNSVGPRRPRSSRCRPISRRIVAGQRVDGCGTAVTLSGTRPVGDNYDIYFGTSSAPPLVAANVNLGPSTESDDVSTGSRSRARARHEGTTGKLCPRPWRIRPPRNRCGASPRPVRRPAVCHRMERRRRRVGRRRGRGVLTARHLQRLWSRRRHLGAADAFHSPTSR